MEQEIVEVSFPGDKRIDARVGDFLIHTDQSVKYGGAATAPEPFALFLASIATCAGIFAWNFCQTRDIPTAGIALRMQCDRDPQKKMITLITLQLTLPAGFPDKYRDGIQRAMEQCAVKKHMQETPAFAVEVV
jgi:putative redox protein